jgi:hypothetical protein
MSAQFQRDIDAFGAAIEESYARRLESVEMGL